MSVEDHGRAGARSEIVQTLDALPPLPAVALRVIQVAQDPRSSAADLAVIVSSDPGLSARVLRIANSAAYRRAQEITSVQQALVVLGFVQARNIAVSTAITSAFPPDSLNALFRVEQFWRHSLAVALRASELAEKARGVEPPTAFTAGILHDMGRLAMFHADPAGLDQVVARVIRGEGDLITLEAAALQYDHAAVGARLAHRWRLPDEIESAIARHHEFGIEPGTLASVVAEADVWCTGAGFLPGYVIPAPMSGEPPVPPTEPRLARQVEELMALILATPAGVSGS